MVEAVTLVPVPVGACRCPDTPHQDGDFVYLYPELGMEAGLRLMAAVDLADGTEGQLTAIYAAMVDGGVADWTFINGTGDKIPINPATIRGTLPWMKGGSEVARAAIRLYAGVLTAPFDSTKTKTTRTTSSSKRGRTGATSTSASRAS